MATSTAAAGAASQGLTLLLLLLAPGRCDAVKEQKEGPAVVLFTFADDFGNHGRGRCSRFHAPLYILYGESLRNIHAGAGA
jgi:hypothetical protein